MSKVYNVIFGHPSLEVMHFNACNEVTTYQDENDAKFMYKKRYEQLMKRIDGYGGEVTRDGKYDFCFNITTLGDAYVRIVESNLQPKNEKTYIMSFNKPYRKRLSDSEYKGKSYLEIQNDICFIDPRAYVIAQELGFKITTSMAQEYGITFYELSELINKRVFCRLDGSIKLIEGMFLNIELHKFVSYYMDKCIIQSETLKELTSMVNNFNVEEEFNKWRLSKSQSYVVSFCGYFNGEFIDYANCSYNKYEDAILAKKRCMSIIVATDMYKQSIKDIEQATKNNLKGNTAVNCVDCEITDNEEIFMVRQGDNFLKVSVSISVDINNI